jgi:predicted alpha/beta hydrolase family esterase
MKKLLVLPGHSPRNKAWGQACAESMLDLFDVVYLQHYDHWDITDGKINWTDEIEKIAITVEGNEEEVGDWYIAAKSIGSILALQAYAKEAIKPVKCLFFGMPLELAQEDVFKQSWTPLSLFPVPSLAFHNDNDPVANYDFTKTKLTALAPTISLITLSGDTHDYVDFTTYAEKIKTFIESQ